MKKEITLDGNHLSIEELDHFCEGALDPNCELKINISQESIKKINAAHEQLLKIASEDKAVYSVNTGFGVFAEVKIEKDKLLELQENIIRSHSVGVGPLLGRDSVISMWILRLNTICRGHTGVSLETLNDVIKILEAGILAEIPSQGSVGASGDLCPSAHATLACLGEGRASAIKDGKFVSMPASEALAGSKVKAIKLKVKEGLSFINGTQLSTALAAKACLRGLRLLKQANLNLAMAMEGLRASHLFLNPLIMKEKKHPGCLHVANEVASWLEGASNIKNSHVDCEMVQDPYSLRCAPQVHGAIFEDLNYAKTIIEREINASNDNPLLFPEHNLSISNGNFHAVYPARASDLISSALSTLSNISERRTALAMNPATSRLPTFLIKEGGLHSGFMMAQVTSAALVSENKSLSFPASVDSIPTNADKEDHVSMGPIAGVKALKITDNTCHVLAIEALCMAQAIELQRPNTSTKKIEAVHSKIRKKIPFLEKDRNLSLDINNMTKLIKQKALGI